MQATICAYRMAIAAPRRATWMFYTLKSHMNSRYSSALICDPNFVINIHADVLTVLNNKYITIYNVLNKH